MDVEPTGRAFGEQLEVKAVCWFLMKKGSSSHHEGVGVEIGALCGMKLGGDDDV